jgi:hypothetical protein
LAINFVLRQNRDSALHEHLRAELLEIQAEARRRALASTETQPDEKISP